MENKLSRNESDEPQISSPDPQERIVARRLRVQKRNLAAKKRLQTLEDGKDISSEEETLLEKQVEKSTVELSTLTHEGRELITNVRVAADAHEVKRRCDQAEAKQRRIQKLEEEANIAQNKFEAINSKWDGIALLNDPLDLNKETELQREKCVDLIAQKDKLIADLKAELKAGDERYVKDQQKQADDITLLVERIDSQIAIMRRAYRRELVLIQEAIDIERKQTMEVNNKKWETLYKQREEDEVNNLQQRFVALSEHNKLMQDILVHHQEKFRATKISLEKDIQVLQQQLEQVKAICLLNKEKMEYNYQVLKKRDEESLLIRSQQKRRINKLQDVVTTLRRKILAMEQSTQAEVKRLTSEVIKLHRNIKDIQLKAQHFCSVNASKYFQLWKFNHDSAQKLCDKILSIDRLIHEQQLGIAWRPVASTPITMRDLPSYRAAVQQGVLNKSTGKEVDGKTSDLSGERVLKQILQAVADRSGFLVEDRLNVLLAPYTRSQTTLVCIDNVFSALGVSRQEDMELLRQTMEPFIVCVTCQPMLEAVRPISPPAFASLDISEEEFKSRVMKKLKDTLEEGEKLAQMKREQLHKESETSDVAADLNPSPRTTESHTDSTVIPWMALSTTEMADHSIMSVLPPSNLDGKIAAQSVFTMVFSSRKPLNPVPDYSSHSDTSTSSSVHEVPKDSIEEEKKEQKEDMVYHDPTHTLSINPVFVLRALREFVQRFQTTKHENKNELWSRREREDGGKKSLSRQISDADVHRYWEQFRAAFPADREKLWDCLHLGLQRYHSMLQERHKVNMQIEQLKVQNADLRRLLQKYALPNNMKTAKETRYNLPPLSVKTPTAPAPTPAKLVLTFNDTSRL